MVHDVAFAGACRVGAAGAPGATGGVRAPPGRPRGRGTCAGATARVDVLARGWRTLRAHATGPARWAYLLVILPAALAVAALLRGI